jgi:hypothetical protein
MLVAFATMLVVLNLDQYMNMLDSPGRRRNQTRIPCVLTVDDASSNLWNRSHFDFE